MDIVSIKLFYIVVHNCDRYKNKQHLAIIIISQCYYDFGIVSLYDAGMRSFIRRNPK